MIRRHFVSLSGGAACGLLMLVLPACSSPAETESVSTESLALSAPAAKTQHRLTAKSRNTPPGVLHLQHGLSDRPSEQTVAAAQAASDEQTGSATANTAVQ